MYRSEVRDAAAMSLRAVRKSAAFLFGATGVALAMLGGSIAAAETDGTDVQPEFCQMLAAFDRAMLRRYYDANFAPTTFDCSFVGPEGCPFLAPREMVIKVTHAKDLGCDAEGDCRFQARQVCEAEPKALYSCQTLMQNFTAHYEVSGEYQLDGDTDAETARWRLVDWRRDPAPAVEAEEFEIAALCPSL